MQWRIRCYAYREPQIFLKWLDCFCHQSTETGKSFPQWSGYCRSDSLHLRFCIIAVILGLLDLVSVRLSLYSGNTTPSWSTAADAKISWTSGKISFVFLFPKIIRSYSAACRKTSCCFSVHSIHHAECGQLVTNWNRIVSKWWFGETAHFQIRIFYEKRVTRCMMDGMNRKTATCFSTSCWIWSDYLWK